MRARLPVPQSRRGLLVAAAVLLLALGGAGAGAAIALGNSSPKGGRLATASFPGFQLSFSYPAAWRREDWCWLGNVESPITLLSTARPPRCAPYGYPLGAGTALPRPQQLGPDGVTAWWNDYGGRTGLSGASPNARLAGRAARITVRQESTRRPRFGVRCVGAGTTQRLLQARIEGPNSRIGQLLAGAVICGPNFAGGEADVRRMLASLRFTS